MSLRQNVMDILQEAPGPYLQELLWHLHISARDSYAGHRGLEDAARGLQGLNEVGLVVAEQLRSLPKGKPAYPDEAFVNILHQKAEIFGCAGALQWSMEQALRWVPRQR